MKSHVSIFLIILMFSFHSCSTDDKNVDQNIGEDVNNISLEIILNHGSQLMDTDFIDLQVSLTNESGNNVSYKEIKWFSDKDGNLENNKFQNKYFLSANQHTISCEVTLDNNDIIVKSINISVIDDPKGNWMLNLPYNGAGSDSFTSDGLVLDTPNFRIFSNTNDISKRLYISEFAERSLSELKELYQISQFDFNGKVYIAHNKDDGRGFTSTFPHFSMYIGMPENGFIDLNGSWNFNIEGIKHELMHLVELTYILPSPSEYTSHRWFWEGIAVLVSNGTRYTSLEQLTNWQNTNGGNPIAIQEQPLGTSSSDGDYYPMFGLSVAYLVDPNGLGKSYEDIINMYNEIKLGETFETAFSNNFDITEDDYKTNYFIIIENYLQQ